MLYRSVTPMVVHWLKNVAQLICWDLQGSLLCSLKDCSDHLPTHRKVQGSPMNLFHIILNTSLGEDIVRSNQLGVVSKKRGPRYNRAGYCPSQFQHQNSPPAPTNTCQHLIASASTCQVRIKFRSVCVG